MALNFGDDEDEYVARSIRERRGSRVNARGLQSLPVETTEDHLRAADEG